MRINRDCAGDAFGSELRHRINLIAKSCARGARVISSSLPQTSTSTQPERIIDNLFQTIHH